MRLVLSFKLSERQNLPHAGPYTICANMFDKLQKISKMKWMFYIVIQNVFSKENLREIWQGSHDE